MNLGGRGDWIPDQVGNDRFLNRGDTKRGLKNKPLRFSLELETKTYFVAGLAPFALFSLATRRALRRAVLLE